jgi:hypothetical protein
MNKMRGEGLTTIYRAMMIAVAIFIAASSVAAQPAQAAPDSDLARFADKLKVGDSIVVTTDTGMQIKGRFFTVSPAGLALHIDNVEQRLPAAEVSRIQLRRNGVLLGALIGAGVGVPFGLALKSWAHNEGGSEAAALAVPILIGLGTGIAIDAFLVRPRTVFDRQSPRATLVPIAAPHTAGVRVAIAF